MSSRRIQIWMITAVIWLALAVSGGTSQNTAEHAVVCRIQGMVKLIAPSGEESAPLLLRRLELGTAVLTGEGAALELVFLDGKRFVFEQASSGVIAKGDIADTTGTVRRLPDVDTVPSLAPLVEGIDIAPEAAVTAIRGDKHSTVIELDPANGDRVLANHPSLHFEALAGVELYRISIERHPELTKVFESETAIGEVTLPTTVLQPGNEYLWSVQTLGPRRPAVHACAVFHTINEDQARLRTDLAEIVSASHDPALLVLLAGIDLRLGLAHHACEDLASAEDNEAVRELATRIGCTAEMLEPGAD